MLFPAISFESKLTSQPPTSTLTGATPYTLSDVVHQRVVEALQQHRAWAFGLGIRTVAVTLCFGQALASFREEDVGVDTSAVGNLSPLGIGIVRDVEAMSPAFHLVSLPAASAIHSQTDE